MKILPAHINNSKLCFVRVLHFSGGLPFIRFGLHLPPYWITHTGFWVRSLKKVSKRSIRTWYGLHFFFVYFRSRYEYKCSWFSIHKWPIAFPQNIWWFSARAEVDIDVKDYVGDGGKPASWQVGNRVEWQFAYLFAHWPFILFRRYLLFIMSLCKSKAINSGGNQKKRPKWWEWQKWCKAPCAHTCEMEQLDEMKFKHVANSEECMHIHFFGDLTLTFSDIGRLFR